MLFRPKFALMILAVILDALGIMLVVDLFMGGGDSGVDEDNSTVDRNTAHDVGPAAMHREVEDARADTVTPGAESPHLVGATRCTFGQTAGTQSG